MHKSPADLTSRPNNVGAGNRLRAIALHDEPSNAELGIVPFTGWSLLLRQLAALLLPYALLALAYGGYLVIAGRMGWL